MQHNSISAKLLIISVDEQHTRQAIETIKEAGATGGTKASGRGFNPQININGVTEAKRQEGLIFSVTTNDPKKILHSLEKASVENPQGLTGMAMAVDVPNILLSLRQAKQQLKSRIQQEERTKAMESGAMLIVCIINHGQADDIMTIARKAGAQGGTIIDARGTGTREDVSFFGISLVPEKEMLLIVARNELYPAILGAISESPIFSEPAAGIIFTVAIEQFILMGAQP